MRVAWFDDEIDDSLGDFLRDSFADAGIDFRDYRVSDRTSLESGVEAALADDFDLALVDWRLGNDRDRVSGTDLIQQLSADWLGPVVILTRHPKHEEIANHIDPRIVLAEAHKPAADEMAAWWEETLLPLVSDATEHHAGGRRELGDDVRSCLADLAPDAEESFEAEMASQLRSAEVLMEHYRSCFDDPAISYVVVGSDPARVTRVGTGQDAAPSAEFIESQQRDHRSRVVTLRRPATVNMVSVTGSTGCRVSPGPTQDTDAYDDWFPTLEVEIGASRREIHVDTGSDQTFLGYRPMGDAVPDRNSASHWGQMEVSVGIGQPRLLQVSEWSTKVSARSRQGQLTKPLRVQLVYDFEGSGLAATCHHTCPVEVPDGEPCPFRPGLLGRDLFRQTGWVLVVNTWGREAFVLTFDDEVVTTRETGTTRRTLFRF